jgi:hypothetical protein
MFRQKFNSKKSGGFASKLEHAVYNLLSLREKAGEISNLKCQGHVELTEAKIVYRPDFTFVENGKMTYAEAKGFETAIWRLKKRLWKSYGPGTLYIYRGNYSNPKLDEVLEGKK